MPNPEAKPNLRSDFLLSLLLLFCNIRGAVNWGSLRFQSTPSSVFFLSHDGDIFFIGPPSPSKLHRPTKCPFSFGCVLCKLQCQRQCQQSALRGSLQINTFHPLPPQQYLASHTNATRTIATPQTHKMGNTLKMEWMGFFTLCYVALLELPRYLLTLAYRPNQHQSPNLSRRRSI